MKAPPGLTGDLICFSHLRWHFVFQRPQHLLSRFARSMRVFFWEEPSFAEIARPTLDVIVTQEAVTVLQPKLPHGLDAAAATRAEKELLDQLLRAERISDPVLWYYTPMALAFSGHLRGHPTVYDCMDELSLFRGAPAAMRDRERQLLARADLVFTGGHSLWKAKREQHRATHLFPSSVDLKHFMAARDGAADPPDQRDIPHPRLGFYGVLDERLDRELLAGAADARPDWHFVMIGPVVKIDPSELPQRPNIHYLGGRSYADLPAYSSGWDLATMPFAQNDATRYISPTKTPEYLAAGLPVISTPIADVIRQYGTLRAVGVARSAEEFVAEGERLLELRRGSTGWLDEADRALADMSWDRTWSRMASLVAERRVKRLQRVPAVLGRAAFDYLIVGAGFAGSVMAERLAAGSGKRVMLVDRRPHVGGNAYDHHDGAGILVHRYGPHIFHTNSTQVSDYLSRFTQWRPYQHRVLAQVGEQRLPVPINRTTINRFFGLDLSAEQVDGFLESKAEPVATIRTAEDVVLGRVGRELYEAFFRGYTRKQWGVDPSELDKSVTARVPTRTDDDDRYFQDSFQNMPLHGFTRMFENMLDHPNIEISLGTEWRDVADRVRHGHLIFTGPVDEFFDYRYGPLPYRSLRFDHRTLEQEWLQQVAVVNYPAPDVPWTRVTEYKHLTGQTHPRTSITYEYPTAEGDPYYPVPRPQNARLYTRYQALADAAANVSFVGRLATYRYYNMDQVVGQALALYARLSGRRPQVPTGGTVGRAAAEARMVPQE